MLHLINGGLTYMYVCIWMWLVRDSLNIAVSRIRWGVHGMAVLVDSPSGAVGT